MKQVSTKTNTTSVEFNNEGSTRKLQQIQFGGSTQALVLSENGSMGSPGQ